jgi:hypothetical protein
VERDGRGDVERFEDDFLEMGSRKKWKEMDEAAA